MKRIAIFILILLLPFLAFSVKRPTNKMKFGKVPMEQLKMTSCEMDSTADAVVLGDYRRYSFDYVPNIGYQITVDVYRRIKVLTNEGVDKVSDFKISLYDHNGTKTKISTFKATTYNLEDDKMVLSKIKKDSRFVVQSDYYNTYKYAFVNVKAGSVLEYKYSTTSNLVTDFPTYYPQESIPVLWSELFVEYFEEIEFKYFVSGSVPAFYSDHNLIQGRVSDTWIYIDVPAIKQEAFMRSVKNYKAKVKYELRKVAFQGRYYKDYTTSWQGIAKDIMDSDRYGGLLGKKKYYKDIVAHVLSDSLNKTPMNTVESALQYIRNNYQWNELHRYRPSYDFADVVKDKKGNSADMNMLLMGALTELGISNKPVILSTRNNGVILQTNPSTDDLNYMVTAFYIDGKKHMVDVATDYSGIDALPSKCLNGQAFVVDKTSGRWISLESEMTYGRKVFVMANIDEEYIVSGAYQAKEIGYAAMDIREDIIDLGGEAKYISDQEEENGDIDITEYSLSNVDDISKDVVVKHKFSTESQVQEMGDLIAFEPIIFKDFEDSPFTKETREFPIDFIYPSSLDYTYIYTLPANWVVDELPKPTRVSNEDKTISFLLNTVARGNSITVSLKFKISKAYFHTNQYAELKSVFDYFIDNQKQLIIIKPE